MADDNVVDFGSWKEKKPEIVWTCGCGGQLFYLIEKDPVVLRCRDCNLVLTDEEEQDD